MESVSAAVLDPYVTVSVALLGYALWRRRTSLRQHDEAGAEVRRRRWLVGQALVAMWLLVIVTASATYVADPPSYVWLPSMVISLVVTLGSILTLRGTPALDDGDTNESRGRWLRWSAVFASLVLVAMVLLSWLVLELTLKQALVNGIVAALSAAAISACLGALVAIMRGR
jgi:hypothetical protein